MKTIFYTLLIFVSIQSYITEAQTMCTMDARMCPDGTYIGRTGPNCEFVCPNTATTTPSIPPKTPPVITPAGSCPNLVMTLRLGHNNTQVKELQKYLYKKYNNTGKPTGYFGGLTRSYVMKFQKENGLKVDGTVNATTLAAIKKICSNSTTTGTSTIPYASCKVWYDGCNTCSRTSPESPWACTMMACIWANEAAATCRQGF